MSIMNRYAIHEMLTFELLENLGFYVRNGLFRRNHEAIIALFTLIHEIAGKDRFGFLR